MSSYVPVSVLAFGWLYLKPSFLTMLSKSFGPSRVIQYFKICMMLEGVWFLTMFMSSVFSLGCLTAILKDVNTITMYMKAFLLLAD